MKIADYGKAITSYIESPTTAQKLQAKEKALLLAERDNVNTPDLEQSPDSFLRPGETLEDFDVTFRRPNSIGGRVRLSDGTKPSAEEAVTQQQIDYTKAKEKPFTLDQFKNKADAYVGALFNNALPLADIKSALNKFTQKGIDDGMFTADEAIEVVQDLRSSYRDRAQKQRLRGVIEGVGDVEREEEADGGRIGFSNGTVEEFVEIVKKMVADPEYMSPININAKEVGKIPNFETAKKIVKEEMGEAEFNQAYQKNINRSRKVRAKEKRKVDTDLRERYLASKAERRRRRRVEKLGDKTKLTPREKYLNFQQSLIAKQLNEKIKKNPNIILKNKKIMNDLATTVDINGNIKKKKVNLSDITDRGIFEIEHQRDIYKKGAMKDFPYNRNLILGPHNRSDGFKATAEKYISKNPNSPKVKTILKKAEELKITLQPDVPDGTFKTKSLGYVQVKDPVKKFIDIAEKSTPEISKDLGVKSYSKNLAKAKQALGMGFKTAGKIIKPLGVGFGVNAVKTAITKAEEQNLDLNFMDKIMAFDSGDAQVALNNAKRRVDPEFAAAERAKDLAQMTDDFEEVGQTTFGKYNDQIKNIKLP